MVWRLELYLLSLEEADCRARQREEPGKRESEACSCRLPGLARGSSAPGKEKMGTGKRPLSLAVSVHPRSVSVSPSGRN